MSNHQRVILVLFSLFLVRECIIPQSGNASENNKSDSIHFEVPLSTAIDSLAIPLAAGDFNRDSKPDLAFARAYSSPVILLNNGNGSFRTVSTPISAPNSAYQSPGILSAVNLRPEIAALNARSSRIQAADFNSDGDLDLLVCESYATLYLGNGDGTFRSGEKTFISSGSSRIVVTDFNNDHKMDLAALNNSSNSASVLLGNGDGTFRETQSINGLQYPIDLAANDLNQDGNADLIIAINGSKTISILLGTSLGTFQPPINLGLTEAPIFITAVDLTGNGVIDLVAATSAGPILIFLGNGDGTFQSASVFSASTNAVNLLTEDFDGDGKPDIAVSDRTSSTISIWLGNGDGTFHPKGSYLSATAPGLMWYWDFDGDGNGDLLTVNDGSTNSGEAKSVMTLLGNGDGTFRAGKRARIDKSLIPMAIVKDDFDRDGLLDVAVACRVSAINSGEVILMKGRGDGTFDLFSHYLIGGVPASIAAGDFNGDSVPELAVTAVNPQTSYGSVILLGSAYAGSGGLSQINTGLSPAGIVAGDFNSDGKIDLAVANSGSDSISILSGIGNGFFASPVNFPAGKTPKGIAIGDFNRDGAIDIAVANNGSGEISVLLGIGDASFSPFASYPTDKGTSAIAVADLNLDRNPDLAVVNRDAGTYTVLLGSSGGKFQKLTTLHLGRTPTSIATGDFNADGTPDLAITDYYGNRLIVLYGDGDGLFSRIESHFAPDHPDAAALCDLNGDNYPDLVFGSSSSDITAFLSRIASPVLPGNIYVGYRTTGKVGTDFDSADAHVGFARLGTSWQAPISSTAVLSLVQNGVVVSETGVPGSMPITAGRIFIEIDDSGGIQTNTGIALVNPGAIDASVRLELRDNNGLTLAIGNGTLAAGRHIARYVDQLGTLFSGFTMPNDFGKKTKYATLTLTSNIPVGILALRMIINERGEVITTTTPTADLTKQLQTSGSLNFPQFADGNGYRSSIILLNTSDDIETGQISFYDDGGNPLKVRLEGNYSASVAPYTIPAGGFYVLRTSGSGNSIIAGSAQVVSSSLALPVGAGLFAYSPNGILITETGIPDSRATNKATIFVDTTRGHNTGLAISNLGDSSITLQLVANFADQESSAIPAPAGTKSSITIASRGHIARFVDELMPDLPKGFVGTLSISTISPYTTGAVFSALVLRSLINTRGDFLLTAFPVGDLPIIDVFPSGKDFFLPQIAFGAGWQTEFILIKNPGLNIELSYDENTVSASGNR